MKTAGEKMHHPSTFLAVPLFLTYHNIIPSGASLFISQIESNPDPQHHVIMRATNTVSPFLSQAFDPTVQD